MLWPTLGPLSDDSFPMSTYPMFARQRGKPRMHKLIGYDANGGTHRLTPADVGTSEVLQAKRLIDQAAHKSRRKRARFCADILQRVQATERTPRIEVVELVRVRFDPLTYFTDGPEPIERKRLARCGKLTPEASKSDASPTSRGAEP
jgi:hypothetical protein